MAPARMPGTTRITVTVRANRRRLEALQLEVRRLARRLGVPIAAVRVRRLRGRPSSAR